MFLSLTLFISVQADNNKGVKKNERYSQEQWCAHRGITEFTLSDKSRVDCETDTHSIEFDWSKKWHEAIGQSLGYYLYTGKRAGIVLIVKKPKHYKHWIKLNSVISQFKLPISTWLIKVYE